MLSSTRCSCWTRAASATDSRTARSRSRMCRYGSGWNRGQSSRRESRLASAEDGQQGVDQPHHGRQRNGHQRRPAPRLQDGQALGQHFAADDDDGQGGDRERRRPRPCPPPRSNWMPTTRGHGEIGEVHQQVPEQHGRQQAVGIAQQSGGDPLRAIARGQQAAFAAAAGRTSAASLVEKKAEQPSSKAMAASQEAYWIMGTG